MDTLLISPLVDSFYHSFYLEGIKEVFGESSIHFSSAPFPLRPSGYLAFVFNGQQTLRVVVDAYDGVALTNLPGLEWCDIYGKVNLDLSVVPREHVHKCLPIGPTFPVKVWGSVHSWWLALRNWRASVDYRFMDQEINSSREHFANY